MWICQTHQISTHTVLEYISKEVCDVRSGDFEDCLPFSPPPPLPVAELLGDTRGDYTPLRAAGITTQKLGPKSWNYSRKVLLKEALPPPSLLFEGIPKMLSMTISTPFHLSFQLAIWLLSKTQWINADSGRRGGCRLREYLRNIIWHFAVSANHHYHLEKMAQTICQSSLSSGKNWPRLRSATGQSPNTLP